MQIDCGFGAFQNELGETPTRIPEEKALAWVDIARHRIFRMDAETKEGDDPGGAVI